MISNRSRQDKRLEKNKAVRPLRQYTKHRCAGTEFLNISHENKREIEKSGGISTPLRRNYQTCELKDIVPYLLSESPKGRQQHNLVSAIAKCVKTFWLGSLFFWEVRPEISRAAAHQQTNFPANPYRALFRFPNDPITAPITSQLSENCVVDLICNQGRKVTLVLWMRKSNTVKFLGHIPERVRQIPFAKEVTGMTYDLKRRLLWVFGNRRLIAFHVNVNPGCISIVYSLCHRLGNMAMEYDPEHDYLVGKFGSFRVTLRQKDC